MAPSSFGKEKSSSLDKGRLWFLLPTALRTPRSRIGSRSGTARMDAERNLAVPPAPAALATVAGLAAPVAAFSAADLDPAAAPAELSVVVDPAPAVRMCSVAGLAAPAAALSAADHVPVAAGLSAAADPAPAAPSAVLSCCACLLACWTQHGLSCGCQLSGGGVKEQKKNHKQKVGKPSARLAVPGTPGRCPGKNTLFRQFFFSKQQEIPWTPGGRPLFVPQVSQGHPAGVLGIF